MEFGDLDDSQRDTLRARLIGEHEDDEQVASDDDEEIDSDAAFEEEDEERFAEFFPNKKKKAAKKDKGVRFAEVDLNEDDEPAPQDRDEDEESVDSEEEGEDDEFIDLLDVLDGKGEVDMPSDDEKALPQSTPQAGSDEDVEMGGDDEDGEGSEKDGSGEEEGDDEEEFTGITVSDDEEAEGDLDNLQNFVSGLSTSAKRKAEETDAEPQQKRKRRMIQERTETGAEDDFRVNASGPYAHTSTRSSSTLTLSISRAAPPSDTSCITLRSSDTLSPITRSPEISTNAAAFGASSSSDPWLATSANALSDSTRITWKANEVVVAKDSKAAEKSKNKLKKEQRKREEERRAVKEGARVDIEMDNVLQLQQPTDASKPKKGKSKSAAAASSAAAGEDDNSDDEGANSEVEAQEQALLSKKKGKGPVTTAFQQRDLVALALMSFANSKKRREIAYAAPKEVDTTLPGWGAWGGTGLKKAPPKPHLVKTLPGIDPATRADYNKKHIIISEKRDKKAAKYMVTDLPYPYTSQKQYERAMERPLGAQWNTRTAFQRATLPRVVKKPGVVITPLKKAL